jgi:hypothetical protein
MMYITNFQYFCALLSMLFMGMAVGMALSQWRTDP